jgi:hypothetical protein
MTKTGKISAGGAVKLVVANVNEENDYPRVVSFPAGVPAQSDDMNILVCHKGTGKKRKTQVLSGLPGLSFRGTDYGDGLTVKSNQYKYAVCQLDSATGVMTLHPTDHIFVMRATGDSDASAPAALSGMTSDERRKTLTEEFGSRKKKRAMLQAASNHILDSNVSGADAVHSAIAESVLSQEADVHQDASEFALEQNRQLMLPPYNEDATSVAEAYEFDRLFAPSLQHVIAQLYDSSMPADISESKSKKLLSASMEAVQALLVRLGAGPSSLAVASAAGSQVQAAMHSTDPEKPALRSKEAADLFKKRCIALLYLHFLCKLYKLLIESKFSTMNKLDLAKAMCGSDGKASASSVPVKSENGGDADADVDMSVEDPLSATVATITQILCKNFCSPAGGKNKDSAMLSKLSSDKLLAFALAAGLHTSETYTLDITALAHDLGLPDANLAKIARTLGGKILRESTASVMHLPVPLKFPGRPRVQAKKR